MSTSSLSAETATDRSTASSCVKKTSLGLIPRDWKVVCLDIVAKRGSGHTPDKEHPEYWGGPIKWISLADSDRLDQVYISETAQTVTPAGIAHSSAVVHPSGTVVLSRDAGIGKSAITTEEMAVSQHFMAWRCGPDLEKLFFYYWLQSKKSEFERIAAGNTIKTIGLPYFRLLEIPLPPLNEQRAISTALLDSDESLKAQDTLIAKKRAIKLATMQQLLGGRTRLPGFTSDWKTVSLASFGRTYGGLGGKTKDDFGRGDARYIPFLNIMNNVVLDPSFLEPVQVCEREHQNHVKKGDLFFNGSSETAEEVGMCSVLLEDVDNVYLNSFCFGFRFDDDATENGLFLAYYFRSSEGRRLLYAEAQGAIRYNLSKTRFLKLPFTLPNRDEQDAIVEVLSDMDAEIAALERRRDKTKSIKQGMMQQLLTGRTRLV